MAVYASAGDVAVPARCVLIYRSAVAVYASAGDVAAVPALCVDIIGALVAQIVNKLIRKF